MKKYWQGVKGILKRRVIVLVTVFGILLLSWYMIVPITVKDCSVGNIQYAHKFFNMCSDKMIYLHPSYPSMHNWDIVYNSNPDKIYTRYNIAGHIANMREANNPPPTRDELYDLFNFSWINTLIIIGHYNEAEDYLRYFPQNYDNFQAVNSIWKEFNCYVKPRRINILACKLLSPITTWQILSKTEVLNKKDIEWAHKYLENSKNDIIEPPKSANPHIQKISSAYEAIEKGQFNLAEKYMNEYCSVKTCNNLVKIKFNLKLGIAYMDKQNYKKAIECFNKILEIQDYNYKAHEKLEICYRKLGNVQKADEHARIMKELLAL